METKNYLLVARTRDGYMQEKVNTSCTLDEAVKFLKSMMLTSPKLVRGEIIDGNRDYIGDFRVRPFLFVSRDREGNFLEETR
jgi:hypothetical protein